MVLISCYGIGTLFATKGALIAFYYELIPKKLTGLRKVLHGITIFTIVGWVISIALKIFIKPPANNWAIGETQYRASYGLEPNAAGWVWHIITNIMSSYSPCHPFEEILFRSSLEMIKLIFCICSIRPTSRFRTEVQGSSPRNTFLCWVHLILRLCIHRTCYHSTNITNGTRIDGRKYESTPEFRHVMAVFFSRSNFRYSRNMLPCLQGTTMSRELVCHASQDGRKQLKRSGMEIRGFERKKRNTKLLEREASCTAAGIGRI